MDFGFRISDFGSKAGIRNQETLREIRNRNPGTRNKPERPRRASFFVLFALAVHAAAFDAGNTIRAQTREAKNTPPPITDLPLRQQPPPPRPGVLQEILVVRTSPGIVRHAEGVLRFQVSAFSPIMVVKVNGFAQMIRPGVDFMEYEVPYQLQPGKNRFLVFVQTREGEDEREILLTYQPPPLGKPREPLPLDLLVILGQTESDNMLQSPDGSSRVNASRNDLLLSLGYFLKLDEQARFTLKGLFKFDRQKNRALASEETLMRQLSVEYRRPDLWEMEMNFGLGQTVLSDKSTAASPAREGEFVKNSESVYIFASAVRGLGKTKELNARVQLDMQNKIASNNEDGMLNLVSVGGKWLVYAFKLSGEIQSRGTGFEDPSKDYQTAVLSLRVTYPWNPWIFDLRFRNSDQKYREPDPGSRITLHNKKDHFSVQSKYAYSKNMIADFSLNSIKQGSNDTTRAYRENQMVFQFIWSY